MSGIDVAKYFDDMSAEENTAIDIYNAWNFDESMTWTEALSLFTPKMRADKQAETWYQMIFRSEQLTKHGTQTSTEEAVTRH